MDKILVDLFVAMETNLFFFEAVEHSENKFIMQFEKKAGPGVLQSNIQQTYTHRNSLNLQHIHKLTQKKHGTC